MTDFQGRIDRPEGGLTVCESNAPRGAGQAGQPQLWPVSDRATPPTEGLLTPGDLRSGVSAGSETRAELQHSCGRSLTEPRR